MLSPEEWRGAVMKEMGAKLYTVRPFTRLKGLTGISDAQIAAHLELYEGYVRNANVLNEQLADLVRAGKAATPAYSEMTRRLGFEYNGMRLHELYFENLVAGRAPLDARTPLCAALSRHFRSVEAWRRNFVTVAGMRGVGWTVLYEDPETGRLSNHWIALHEHGHPVGFVPLLVMDVWEHAFMVDYKATERRRYVDAFFSNVDWGIVEGRFAVGEERRSARTA